MLGHISLSPARLAARRGSKILKQSMLRSPSARKVHGYCQVPKPPLVQLRLLVLSDSAPVALQPLTQQSSKGRLKLSPTLPHDQALPVQLRLPRLPRCLAAMLDAFNKFKTTSRLTTDGSPNRLPLLATMKRHAPRLSLLPLPLLLP